MTEFTEGDKAIIRETARTVVLELMPSFIVTHVENCKHGKRLTRLCYMGIGLSVGLGLTNAGLWLKLLGVIG